MKKLLNVNFKKVIVIFLLCSLFIGVVTVGVGAYVFKEKICFMNSYNNIKEDFKNGYDESLKEKIQKLSNNSKDIAEVIVLDSNNNVIYFTNKSQLVVSSDFKLDYLESNHKYLINGNNEDVVFHLQDKKDLYLSILVNKNVNEILKEYDDDSFFLENIQNKKVYGLSYTLNKKNNEKIYFVTSIVNEKKIDIYFEICEIILMLIVAMYLIIVALWAYQNAKLNYLNAPLWGIIVLFTNIIGVIIYAIYKKEKIACPKCHFVQSKGNAYCTNCGEKLLVVCDNCLDPIDINDKYCPHCGEKIK